jgi:Mg-chelatase subunit ChlD
MVWDMRRMFALSAAALALAAAAHVGPAGAATLVALGSGEIVEAGYQLDIDVRGLVATVEARQTLLNTGPADSEAIYTFELPAEAIVTGLAVTPHAGATETGVVVAAEAAVTVAPDHSVVAAVPDLGLLRIVAEGETATRDQPGETSTYELRLYPVSAGRTLTAAVRWVMPVGVDGGRLLLRLPGRGAAANLSRETGHVRFRAGPAIRGYLDVHADGKRLAARAGASRLAFASSRSGDLRIEATVQVAGAAPVAWADTIAVDAGRGVVALSALSPRVLRADPLADRQILVVVDTSRSVDRAGLDAAARAVDAILAAAAPSATIEGVLFDRTARRVLGGWKPAAARGELVTAIRAAPPGNGSDLVAALDLAGAVLAGGQPDAPTLIVVVTDGVLPADVDAELLRQHLPASPRTVDLGAVVIVPDAAAVPDVRWSALGQLAAHFGGRALPLRPAEIDQRAATLATELHEPDPLTVDGVEADGATVGPIDVPEVLAPGGGWVALAAYRGGKPRAIRLAARRGSEPVAIAARPTADGAAILALAAASPHAIAGRGDADADAGLVATVTQALRDVRRQRGVVGPTSSLVALRRGPTTKPRLALIAAGGPFTRVPAPAELAPGHRFEPFAPRSLAARSTATSGSLPPDVVKSFLNQQLVPRARGCLARALAGGRAVSGTLRVELELTRGEMMAARIAAGSLADAVLGPCVVDAAYDLVVPATALGSEPDPIYLVRYPLRFETRGDQPITILGDADSAQPIDPGITIDVEDPMGDLRRKP